MSNEATAGEPADRLLEACESAVRRLAGAESAGPDQDPFQTIGEALFWLYALAEDRRQQHHPLILGLAWARDRIGHGVLVAAPVERSATGAYGTGSYGGTPYGGGSELTWLPRSRIQVSPRSWHQRDKENAYDERLAGRSVLTTIRTALHYLDSVN